MKQRNSRSAAAAARTNQVQRDRLIQAILTYEGEISNARLRERLGVENVQASRILRDFRSRFPGVVRKSGAGSSGVWRLAKPISLIQFDGGFDEYISLAGLPGVDVESSSLDVTHVDPVLFWGIRSAMLDGDGLRVRYFSMNAPEGLERTLYPTALARAGRRWHLRAYDCLRERFGNFNLGRMEPATEGPVADWEGSAEDDHEWLHYIALVVRPHPDLTAPQSEVIQRELLGGNPEMSIRCRRALAEFILQDMRVSYREDMRPMDYQLALANAEALEASWLRGATRDVT